MASRVQTPLGSTLPSQYPGRPYCLYVPTSALAVLVIIVTLCGLAYVLLLSPPHVTSARDELLCRTQDCLYQAEIVNKYLNASVNPCVDFDAYVCSIWNRHEASSREDVHCIMDVGFKLWVDDFEENLRRAVPHLPIAERVLSVFASCMEDVSPEESLRDMAHLQMFMSDLRIPWPDAPIEDVDPLEVAIDLSVNWRVGPWFDITQLRLANGIANVIFRPARLYRIWLPIELQVAAAGAHRAIWDGLYSVLAPNQLPRPSSEINSILKTHREIFEDLTRVTRAKPTTPSRFPLMKISSRIPNVSVSRWIRALEASTGYPFHLTDEVTFSDKALLEAMKNIFSRHKNTAIQHHLAWTFVQVFASIADRNFMTHTLGSRVKALERRRSFCATEVEAAYRWLIVSLRVLTDFGPERRGAIDASLNEVTLALLSKLDNLSWAGPGFRRALSNKILNVSVTLWPKGKFLSPEGLSDFYAGWFNARSFTEHWITAMRKWRHLNIPTTLSEQPRNFLLPFIRYDYFLNAVRVALLAMQPPWYYANGTKAMAYGSLGFFYTLQLVRSFDAIGLKIDPDGRVSDSWLPEETKVVTTKKAACLGSGRGYDDYFPEIPAMEAAHAVFEAAVTDRDRSQVVIGGLSEDQLFFFAACFALCGLQDEPEVAPQVSCNKAVANFPPFAEAFRCHENDAMNPPNKCPFFD